MLQLISELAFCLFSVLLLLMLLLLLLYVMKDNPDLDSVLARFGF